MKFKLADKNALQREFGFLRQTVAKEKTTIPALEYTQIEAQGKSSLRLTATNLDQTLTCETEAVVQSPGTIALKTIKLHEILNQLPNDVEVVFERQDNNRVQIKSGKAKFLLAGLETKDFPELPRFKETKAQLPAQLLAVMIERTRFAMTRIESKYALAAAKLILRKAGVRMVTTDCHRLALIDNRTIKNEAQFDCLIPQSTILAVSRLAAAHEGEVAIGVDENHIYFEIGPRKLVSRQLAGQFPRYEMILPKENQNDKRIEFECAELLATLRRVGVMAEDSSRTLKFEFRRDRLTVKAEEDQLGAAEESMEIDYKHKAVTIGVNSSYLIDFLAVLGSGPVSFEFSDAKNAINVRSVGEPGFNSQTVIMPINLPADQTNDAKEDESPPADASATPTAPTAKDSSTAETEGEGTPEPRPRRSRTSPASQPITAEAAQAETDEQATTEADEALPKAA